MFLAATKRPANTAVRDATSFTALLAATSPGNILNVRRVFTETASVKNWHPTKLMMNQSSK